MEDVYRFQEVDSDDERNGVLVEPAQHNFSHNSHFNPDKLYFNDMDLRAWENRTGAVDPLAYGEDYGYEDEGYYEDPASQAEYEEYLFQSVLDKIRTARSTGEPDVQLTPEELDIYRTRLLGPRAPAARPQPAARPVSAPVPVPMPMPPGQKMPMSMSMAGAPNGIVTNNTVSPGSSATRPSKGKHRTSFFSRPKKEKTSSRKRAPSNASQAVGQSPPAYAMPPVNAQPIGHGPGFVVPGPNGQPIYAPVNAYSDYISQEPIVQPTGPPARPDRRPMAPNQQPPSSRQASVQSTPDWQLPADVRSRSSSIQQPAKLVPFPVAEYQHYSAEPYQYQMPGSAVASSSSLQQHPQPQPVRRVTSGPGSASGNYMAMPRRVPVPVQHATAPVQGSYSEPALGLGIRAGRAEVSEGDAGEDGPIVVDVAPNADEKGYRVQTVKPGASGGGSGGGKPNERRRRTSRRKS